MKSKLQMLAASFLMTASALWLTSCSSDDVVQSGTSKADLSLTLKINTGNVGTRATAWSTDPAGADKTQTENQVNSLTVGIFSSDGSKVKTIVELTPQTTGLNSLTKTNQGAVAKIVTTSLSDQDKVCIAVNAPAGKFTGVTNVSGFEAVPEDAKDALANSRETEEENTHIPMYGKGTLTDKSGGNFEATVNVKHQLAKISLESLTVNFDPNGPYANASFTPTEFFLVNVPQQLAFSDNAWVVGSTDHFHGMSSTTYSQLTAASAWGDYKEYLSSAAVSSTALEGTTGSYGNSCYFYVTPSDNTTDAGKMKLIIAGDFKVNKNGSTTQDGTVFYPVNLNANYKATDGSNSKTPTAADGGTLFQISPNKNYKCSVVIKTIGTSDPTKSLDPQTADITVSVKDFDDASQTTTFE